MSVYFHGNFGLNREYMAGVLGRSLANPDADATEIAEPFGYKAPFTSRYRAWLVKTGIANRANTTELTPFGEVVWKKDPKLNSSTTQWFLHHQLTADPESAEAWYHFQREFISKLRFFTGKELAVSLSMKLMQHDPSHFAEDAPMIKVITRKIIQCYTLQEALGGLGLVSEVGRDKYRVNDIDVRGPWSQIAELREAYGRT